MDESYSISLADFLSLAEHELDAFAEQNEDNSKYIKEEAPSQCILQNIYSYLYSLKIFGYKGKRFELTLN